jgi:hypothetical protein
MPDVPVMDETCRFLSDPQLDGRHPGGAGHEIAKRYLQDILGRLGFQPLFGGSWFQAVMDGTEQVGENIAGRWPGRSGRSLLLAAHYDHFKGIPGADDNAAALSIVIETCRRLGPWAGEHDLVVCFFDLEEPPYFQTDIMGSVYFTEHCPINLDTLDCAMVLDLCGHDVSIPGCENALFVLGAEYAHELVQAVQSTESSVISTYLFKNERIGDMSDHYGFRLAGRPFLFFSCGWWKHYHRSTDTFDRLNLSKMQGIAEYLVRLIHNLDQRTVRINPVHDFGRIEAESLKRLMGGELPLVLDGSITQIIEQMCR